MSTHGFFAALSHYSLMSSFACVGFAGYGLAAVQAASRFRCAPSSMEIPMTAVSSVRVTKNLGMLLLAIWLIISGLIPLLNLSFEGLGTLLAVLAVAAGALILIGR